MVMLLMRGKKGPVKTSFPADAWEQKLSVEKKEKGRWDFVAAAHEAQTETHRCEKLIAHVFTLNSYLANVTHNTPGPVYPRSFALRPG